MLTAKIKNKTRQVRMFPCLFGITFLAALSLTIVDHAGAWTPVAVKDDPLVRMPGTQQDGGVTFDPPSYCANCHGGYDEAVEPFDNWMGSMMTQSARDPIFYAAMTVAGQDSLWAVGTPDAMDICERCHFPEGWMGNRSDPPNASLMTGSDFDGVHCDVCHKMWDPFFETTYDGTREGSDWTGYWDEAGNTGPGSGTLSQTAADSTYAEDATLSTAITLFSGENFFVGNLPAYGSYLENSGGQFFVSTDTEKRAGFSDATDTFHPVFYSRYHKSKYLCSACHDVSNPVLANLGLSGLTDQSGGEDLISEQYSAARYFHVERTFSEFMLSDYGLQGGAATNPEFQSQGASTVTWAAKCQDCHLNDVTGAASFIASALIRPTENTEHPNSGLPLHNLTGGNMWMSHILASLDPDGPVYDPTNVQILDQGPATLTLDLDAGETPKENGAALKAGAERAKKQLQLAATIKDAYYELSTGMLSLKVQNNTGHKLISGFPEGRRMFLNVKVYLDSDLIHEINPYDNTVGTLKGLPNVPGSPPLSAGEAYVDALVYEMHPRSDLTGEDKTFHFALATGRYKDNRIPPKGFDISNAAERLCEPVWQGAGSSGFFTEDEYGGGYDEVSVSLPPGADRIVITLNYQGTSREYIEFLRDEINGTATTLASPTPSGEPQAYIIQTDPFFVQLKAWGNAIWDLWYHNHGLDGMGASVEGIVPYAMAQEEFYVCRSDTNCDTKVNLADLVTMKGEFLRTDCAPDTPCQADCDGDGKVNLADLVIMKGEFLLTDCQPCPE